MSVTILQFVLCNLFISQNVTCTYHERKAIKRKTQKKSKKEIGQITHKGKEKNNSMGIIENEQNTRKL